MDNKNYTWNKGANGDSADQPVTVIVEKQKLTIPTITNPQEYTGSALQFVLADFNAGQYISMDGVIAANGSAVTYSSSTGETDNDKMDTFEATNVGKYTVKLSLRDTQNYSWDDNTAFTKNVEFEITEKELLPALPVSSSVNGTNGAEWKFGDSTVTITITDDRVTGENINLLCYYDVAGGTSKANTLTLNTAGNVTTITMPTNIAVGKYTLTVELNGSTGDNANYKITKNNTLDFEVTSGKLDPSKYDWTYTKDGAAGGTSANDGSLKVPFELKPNNTIDGVKYELSIQIPTSDASAVQVDTSKHVNGYLTRSGDKVNTYKTTVALKSVDPDFKFEVNGNMQSTCEVEFSWEIEKGTFDLKDVKWEYSLTGNAPWTEYDSSNPPQYNDGYDITIRIKASTLPTGLTLDSLYTGIDESDVNNYTATISVSDLKYNTNNFNAPDVSKLNLSWEIAKKNLFTSFKNVVEPFSNADYSGNIILKQLDLDPAYAGYIDYVYYDKDSGLQVTLQDIKDAVDLTNPHNYKVEAYINPTYASNYAVDDNGATPSDQFTTGSNNKLATATIDGGDGSLPITAEYDGNTHFDSSLVKITSDDGLNVTDFTVKYYKGTKPVAGNELAAGELPKDAGNYCVEIILGTQAAKKYILAKETFTVTVEAKGIDLPTLGTITFNGKEQSFADNLSGNSWTTYGPAGLDIIKVDGKLSDRNVGAGNYVTTLELTDTNYKWIYPTTRSLAKYSLTADEVKVTGDDVTATYNWNITPLIVDTTNMWNKGKTGATLNLPSNIRDFIAGGTLELGYRYYDGDGNFIEEPELKGGKSFRVEAVFGGDDAERNIQFKRSDNEFGAVSKGIDYTVPQGGAAAFFGKVKDALTTSYLGLPLWAWLLIALAVLILLIVIIVVCVKRRKSKEEKEEIKARKEEEKRLKEEERQRREEEREAERQRREEERRLQQEKLEAERELAKAKQEAELEKIRAQAQMAAGAGAAGMATMAVAQPKQVQQVPVQQVQTVDNDVLKEMRQQMAELRADNKMTQAQLRALQNSQNQPQIVQMPQPVYQQPAMMPMPQPQYYQQPMMPQMPMQMPMPNYGGGDNSAIARMEAQLNAMQAEQRARYDAEQRIEIAAMRAEQHVDRDSRHSVDLAAMREHINGYSGSRVPDYSQPAPQPQQPQPNSLDTLGALVAATLKNMVNGTAPAAQPQPVPELPQKAEQGAPVTAKYPSDAVITTTTTVDTTKNKPLRREEDSNFDIDGFYDPLD